MIPVTSIFKCPFHEGLFKLFKGLAKLRVQELGMMVIGNTGVLWVSANVNNFAAFGGEEFWWQHGHWHVALDDSRRGKLSNKENFKLLSRSKYKKCYKNTNMQ